MPATTIQIVKLPLARSDSPLPENMPCLVGLLIRLLLLAGCSNRAMYEAIGSNHLQTCTELPIPQQKACTAQYQTSYDAYRRELEKIEIEERLSN